MARLAGHALPAHQLPALEQISLPLEVSDAGAWTEGCRHGGTGLWLRAVKCFPKLAGTGWLDLRRTPHTQGLSPFSLPDVGTSAASQACLRKKTKAGWGLGLCCFLELDMDESLCVSYRYKEWSVRPPGLPDCKEDLPRSLKVLL